MGRHHRKDIFESFLFNTQVLSVLILFYQGPLTCLVVVVVVLGFTEREEEYEVKFDLAERLYFTGRKDKVKKVTVQNPFPT